MAQQLKNTLAFAIAPGATLVIPHGLQGANGPPLAPDIIFVPSETLEVASDATNVTLTNRGGAPAEGSVLVESWHSIERAFGDVNDENLPVKPYIVVSPEGGNQPPQPPFIPNSEIFIYVRLTGNDTTGQGTLAAPYRTVQRAVRDVPSEIPAGTIYRIDCTGIGTEIMPTQYIFPVFHGAESIGEFDFSQRYFHYFAAVNIQADPRLATGVTGITTIPVTATFSTPKASTGLRRITSPGAGWTPGQLKGKFCVGAGLGSQHSVIWDNGIDYIDITTRSTTILPVEIMECSAELAADKDPADLHQAAINVNNTQMGLLGIKVRSLNTIPGQFGGWGLQVAGTTPPTSVQLCDLPGAGFVAESWVRCRATYLSDMLFAMSPLLMLRTYLRRSLEVVPMGPRVTVWGARGLDSLIRECTLEEFSTMRFRDLFDTHESGSIGLCAIQFSQLLNPVVDFPPIPGPAIQDGIYWTGCELRMEACDITRTPSDPLFGVGVAVRADGPGANVSLRSITGTGWDIGAVAANGGAITQDDIGGSWPAFPGGPPVAFGLTTLGASVGVDSFQPGSGAIEAAWPATVYPAAGANFPDFTGAAAQGARVWRKS